jgi:DNA transformation protein and related proteins
MSAEPFQEKKLEEMPNIGRTLADQLRAAGIPGPAELRALGTEQVFLRLRAADPGACYSKICALQGAVEGIRWHHLSAETKARLKEFLAMTDRCG